jgi:hypothetical protein
MLLILRRNVLRLINQLFYFLLFLVDLFCMEPSRVEILDTSLIEKIIGTFEYLY